MAPLIYLDTHAMVWLYAGNTERLPTATRKAINENEVLISQPIQGAIQGATLLPRLAPDRCCRPRRAGVLCARKSGHRSQDEAWVLV